MNREHCRFERGPIRPPNESKSLLLRFTRNCPWNHCEFCPVYKKRKFSLRSIDEIKSDIDAACRIYNDILNLSIKIGENGIVNDSVIAHIYENPTVHKCIKSIALWMYYGTNSCFLQDADNLVMRTDSLIDVLLYLKNKFPMLSRITTYSRSKTVLKKTIGELREICIAGLDRIHIGLETGNDLLLKMMKKGVTGVEHVSAGRRVIEAGMELSEYVMPGLGGKKMSYSHAMDTAAVLNAINPHYIRLRTLRVPESVPLYEKVSDGTFALQTDDEVITEIRCFIQSLDGINSTLYSDHTMNLLEGISGQFPDDKKRMISLAEEYLSLSEEDRWIFRAGKRGGAFREVKDMYTDRRTYQKIRLFIAHIKKKEGEYGINRMISEMTHSFI